MLRRLVAFALLSLIALTACMPEEAPLPTLASLPTATASFTPSATPTATDTATFVPTPTATLTATATLTPTATLTATATNTARPTATFTPSLTFTPTVTATATATNTPPATNTPSVPTVMTFQSNVTSGAPLSQVTFRWQVEADSARLERLNVAGQVQESIPVDNIGALTLTLPNNGETQAIYRLVAVRGTEQASLSIPITMQDVCTVQWFFTNPKVGIGCPATLGQSYSGVFQQFQSGYFFRVTIGALDVVCGVQTAQQLYTCANYVAYTGTPPQVPPTSFFAPAPEFAKPFYDGLAIGGLWSSVIGWGTATASATTFTAQLDTNNRIAIALPDGNAYRFNPSAVGGAVERLNQ